MVSSCFEVLYDQLADLGRGNPRGFPFSYMQWLVWPHFSLKRHVNVVKYFRRKMCET